MPRSCAAVWASESYDYAMPSRQPASIPAWTLNPRFGWPVAIVALGGLTVALAPLLGEAEIVAVTMVFLLIVLLVSATWGYAVGLFSAVLADLLLNLFFVPPLHTVAVQEPRNVAALVVFLAVAIVGASMLALLRGQLAVARRSTEELATMLNLSRDLALAATPEGALAVLAQSVSRTVRAKRCDILRLTGGAWVVVVSTGGGNGLNRDEAALANAAIESGRVSRRSTGNQPGRASLLRSRQRPATDTFLPFRTAGGELGVIRILGALTAPRSGDLDALLQAFADEAGVAIHRVRLAEQARQAEALQQSDEFKSVLLSSVSHDLRSPLTAIKAAVGSLRTGDVDWTDEDRDQLLGAIESQADRLTATVADLLEMSRLEGGAIKPTLEPTSIAVIFQDAMVATQAATTGRHLCVDAPEDSGCAPITVSSSKRSRTLSRMPQSIRRHTVRSSFVRKRRKGGSSWKSPTTVRESRRSICPTFSTSSIAVAPERRSPVRGLVSRLSAPWSSSAEAASPSTRHRVAPDSGSAFLHRDHRSERSAHSRGR